MPTRRSPSTAAPNARKAVAKRKPTTKAVPGPAAAKKAAVKTPARKAVPAKAKAPAAKKSVRAGGTAVASNLKIVDAPPSVPEQASAPEPWELFRGTRTFGNAISRLPSPPPWRQPRGETAPPTVPVRETSYTNATRQRATTFITDAQVRRLVNAALVLRRPLLVTGKPGSGKSSLIDAVAYELGLGEPLRWNITSRSSLRDGLYQYDAVGRLQDQGPRHPEAGTQAAQGIGPYLRLGPLGTALLPSRQPRALLIDEIDKSDVDLPNDLLNVLENGEFEIPELSRLNHDAPLTIGVHQSEQSAPITRGRVQSFEFPFVIFTSNGERGFPAAFLRRCLQLDMPDPSQNEAQLMRIVNEHLSSLIAEPGKQDDARKRVSDFATRAKKDALSTDQLLNAVFLVTARGDVPMQSREELVTLITRALG